ncbi:hypothetical protein EON65_36200 [archaeon]|nr:MAG: hypothetical protein EON65_36200 [archaeon]
MSYQLAKLYPELVESRLVRTYRSYLPGKAGSEWQKSLRKWRKKQKSQRLLQHRILPHSYPSPSSADQRDEVDVESGQAAQSGRHGGASGNSSVGKRSGSGKDVRFWLSLPKRLSLSLILHMVVTVPPIMQRLVTRLMEPLLLVAVVFYFLLLQEQPIALVLSIVLLVLWLLYLVWNYLQAKKQSRSKMNAENEGEFNGSGDEILGQNGQQVDCDVVLMASRSMLFGDELTGSEVVLPLLSLPAYAVDEMQDLQREYSSGEDSLSLKQLVYLTDDDQTKQPTIRGKQELDDESELEVESSSNGSKSFMEVMRGLPGYDSCSDEDINEEESFEQSILRGKVMDSHEEQVEKSFNVEDVQGSVLDYQVFQREKYKLMSLKEHAKQPR